jgi:hypothetical protein
MRGTDNAEMAAVQGSDGGGAVPLGDRDDDCVCGAQGQVGVAFHELRRSADVGLNHRYQVVHAVGDIAKEADLSLDAGATGQHVADLSK